MKALAINILFCFVLLLLQFSVGIGQTDTCAGKRLLISKPNQAFFCVGDTIRLSAVGDGLSNYQWRFCHGDYASEPDTLVLRNFSARLNNSFGHHLFQWKGEWYSMFTNFGASSIVSAKWGQDLRNTLPEISSESSFIGLNRPIGIQALQDPKSDTLIVFVFDFGLGTYFRAFYGRGPMFPPTRVQSMGSANGTTYNIDHVVYNGEHYLFVPLVANRGLMVVSFGDSWANPVKQSWTYSLPSTGDTRANSARVVDLGCGKFSVFMCTEGSLVLRCDFDEGFDKAPRITELVFTGSNLNGLLPSNTFFDYDGENWRMFISAAGILGIANLGQNLRINTIPLTTLPLNTAISRTLQGINLNGGMLLFTLSNVAVGNLMQRTHFKGNCGMNVSTATGAVPPPLVLQNAGTTKILLTAKDPANNLFTVSDSLTVRTNALTRFTNLDSCVGQPIRFIDASTITGDTIMRREWDFGFDGGTSTEQNPSVDFPSEGTFAVRLKVTVGSGCANESTQQIRIYPIPEVNFSFTTPCANGAVDFTNNTTINGGGAVTRYIWQFGNNDGSTDFNPSYVYPTAGNYTVRLTAITNQNCTVTQTKSLSVPQLNYSAVGACVSENTSFRLEAQYGTDAIQEVSWRFADGQTLSGTVVERSFMQAGGYPFFLKVRTTNGCLDSIRFVKQIDTKPILRFTDNANACQNTDLPFTISAPQAQAVNWQIETAAGAVIATGSGTKPAATLPLGSYILKAQAATTAGCAALPIQKSFQVFPLPEPILELDSNRCTDVFLPFRDKSRFIAARSWLLSDGRTATLSEPVFRFQNAGDYTIQLTVIDSNGCVASTVRNFRVDSVEMPIFTLKQESKNAPYRVAINGLKTQSGVSYLWQINNQDTILNNTELSFADTGNYTLTVIAQKGFCSRRYSQTITILQADTVIDIRLVDFEAGSREGALRPALSIQNRSSIPLDTFELTLQYSNEAPIKVRRVLRPPLLPNEQRLFLADVAVPLQASAVELLCIYVRPIPFANREGNTQDNTLCKSLNGSNAIFPPFPNPSQNTVTLKAFLVKDSYLEVRVVNNLGAVCWQQTGQFYPAGNWQVTIPAQLLARGVYYVEFNLDDNRTVYKIILY